MHRIVLLNHLDTSPAILGNLVDVCAFQKPERDVAVPQRIEGSAVALSVEFQVNLGQNVIQLLVMICRKKTVGRFRWISFFQPL